MRFRVVNWERIGLKGGGKERGKDIIKKGGNEEKRNKGIEGKK